MSSSAITTQVAQLKIGNVQNQADSSGVYSAGVWSFKNSTALTSVTITDSGNVGIGTASPSSTSGKALHIFNDANTGTVASNSFLLIQSQNRNAALELTGSASGLNSISFSSTVGTSVASLVGDVANQAIYFRTGGITERMRIDASGNLLVGKTVAQDTNQNGILIYGGASIAGVMTATVSNDTGAINTYHVYNTSAGAYRFYVSRAGQINATSTSITAISDVSLKENVRDLETGLSQILALKPRRFDWKEETEIDEKNVAGFIAQEVEEVLPELVYEYKYNETETKKSLKMGDMLPTLVKAIQEQQAQIEALKAEVAALKAP